MIDRTITEEFYIIKVNPNWFQLRLTYNRECIATATTLDDILEKLVTIVKRYETGDAIRYAWKNTDIRKLSEIMQDRNEEEYKLHKDDYRTHIENIIEPLTVIKLTPPKKPKRLTPKRKVVEEPKIETRDVKIEPPIKKKISFKPRKVKKLIK